MTSGQVCRPIRLSQWPLEIRLAGWQPGRLAVGRLTAYTHKARRQVMCAGYTQLGTASWKNSKQKTARLVVINARCPPPVALFAMPRPNCPQILASFLVAKLLLLEPLEALAEMLEMSGAANLGTLVAMLRFLPHYSPGQSLLMSAILPEADTAQSSESHPRK